MTPVRGSQVAKDRVISAVMGVFALVWLFPIAWTLWSSLRPYTEIQARGVFSWPDRLSLSNYGEAIRRMELPTYLWNSVMITVPAVVLTLFLGSLIAFVVSRYSFKFNVGLLLLFTAAAWWLNRTFWRDIK